MIGWYKSSTDNADPEIRPVENKKILNEWQFIQKKMFQLTKMELLVEVRIPIKQICYRFTVFRMNSQNSPKFQAQGFLRFADKN